MKVRRKCSELQMEVLFNFNINNQPCYIQVSYLDSDYHKTQHPFCHVTLTMADFRADDDYFWTN